jgi:hypothetical protein
MSKSIKVRVKSTKDIAAQKDLKVLLDAARADLASLATQFNQLRTDYNANATIATDTTATAVTLTLLS